MRDAEVVAKVGLASFTSITWRLFKLPELDDRCEDYGQVATYAEAIPGVGDRFRLDDHHTFERGRPERVSGNTAAMLSQTRLSPFFRVSGDRSTHFGIFPGSATIAATDAPATLSNAPVIASSAPTTGSSCC